MYYISAQPDQPYFKWQLEVQLHNFRKNKIPANKIHVLVAYSPEAGIHPEFQKLAKQQQNSAHFFFYEDNRVNRSYVPSLRPHIIKKHFLECPYLNDASIFYHDADIIFRELPDFERLCKGDVWYVSDTRSYLSADYLKSIGDVVFHEMCELMNVNKELILNNNDNAGGAQYIIKYVNYQFWDKVETDCERLYKYLNANKERYAEMYCNTVGINRDAYRSLQDWCADMWAVLWNGLNMGYRIEIDKELDFSWPTEPLSRWEKTKIFHNSGVTQGLSDKYFYKGGFYNSVPYDITLDNIVKDKCTIKYVEAIQDYMKSRRMDLKDVTFLLPVRIDSQDRLHNLITVTNFINEHFDTHILVLEADDTSKISDIVLPACVRRIFVRDDDLFFHRTRYNNQMIQQSDTTIISLYDVDVVLSPTQIFEAVARIRSKKSAVVYPYDGTCVSINDPEMKQWFGIKLDIRLFSQNLVPYSIKSFGGAVFIDKNIYISCGMENERIFKWGPEDIERAKRLEILGYKYERVEGTLYHLYHQRAEKSGYASDDDYISLMQEYIRICKMNKEELLEEIATWQQHTLTAVS